jgi:flagellar biosynthesis protein FliP
MNFDPQSALLAMVASPFIQSFLITLLLLVGLGFRDWSAGLLAVLFGSLIAFVSAVNTGQSWLPSAEESSAEYLSRRLQTTSQFASDDEVKEVHDRFFTSQSELTDEQQQHITLVVSVFNQFKGGLSQGLFLLIPFLVIELVVAVFFVLCRLEMVSLLFATLPLKIFLFLSVDGVEMFRALLLGTTAS